jgi:MFS family permease
VIGTLCTVGRHFNLEFPRPEVEHGKHGTDSYQGIPFLGAPIITPITARLHKYKRQMIWAGWATCIAGLIAGSFATKAWHLIVTQGVLYGLGFLVLYYALLSMLNEWFNRKRGFAYGILFAAAGLSGTGLPFLMQKVLFRFGFAYTLRGYALAIAILIGPVLPLCKGRLPYKDDEPSHSPNWRILRNPLFWLLSLSNIFQGMGFYLPGIYLPSELFGLHQSHEDFN